MPVRYFKAKNQTIPLTSESDKNIFFLAIAIAPRQPVPQWRATLLRLCVLWISDLGISDEG